MALIGASSSIGLLVLSVSVTVLWPYAAGALALIVGLAAVAWKHLDERRGLEKLVPFGPVLFAVPMAVFSGDHFAFARGVATVVPSWMPWHLFWTYFVGTALMAAALSLAAKKDSQFAAALLGLMLLLFVLMIHIPNCFATPHDKSRFTVMARDLALSAGAFSFAASQAAESQRGAYRGMGLALGSAAWIKLVPITRFVIGLVLTDFGIQHFLFPHFAPGIPEEGPGVMVTMPPWIPEHAFWAYLTGTILVVCGIALILNRAPRVAATVVAAVVVVLIVFVYVPLTIEHASNIGMGLNYLAIHFALAGDALLLAGALPKRSASRAAVAETEAAGVRRAPSS